MAGMNGELRRHPVCTKRITLNNGQFGAAGEDEKLKSSIIHAIKSGYRLIDTAQYYGVESVVGEAVRECGIPRSDITVVTKFWPSRGHEPEKALEESLRDMKLDYIDVLLQHWPATMTPDEKPLPYPGKPTFIEVYKSMEKLVGPKLRAIGVSNYTQKLLTSLLQEVSIVPAINQVELHALNPNLKLVPFCQSRGIQAMSWSTMGSERLPGEENQILHNPLFTQIAKNHDCSAAVVSLSWAVQRNIIVIPKSSSVKRIEENIRLVTLSDEEMQTINQAHEKIFKLRLSNTIPGMQYKLNGKDTILGWSYQDFGWEDEHGNWLL
ncbi:Aldo/keto reductase [Rhizodiscina lignyota]|uniref:Aldo/keto reductase n=1 Tax=Rhizodiscina lignyota TaxID=1504668 RepID=A0A9P4M3U9_9PEZI|nr:Aldo/keto reductase [Rhizodiscina lignyota]